MFVDQADIEVFAGDGGRGCVSFRKEKYIPHGGPDGGDGGDGGSVFLQATAGVDTLLDMVGRHHWHATSGENGMGKKKAGSDGNDLLIRVPPGTLIYDRTSGLLLADLKTAEQRVEVAKGGRGGKGNVHFATSVRQAPDFAEPGGKGQTRGLHLELRLIADVGIVGLPNAGKSTLLSRLSAARPKIADYPFTTLAPQLGIAALDNERRLVIADIPGLIEGAHEGAGLGQDFLRHIERTRVLVHLVDVLPLDGTSPIQAYRQIRAELEAYSPKLAGKSEILAVNKMDLEGASAALAELRDALPGKQIFAISAVAGSGLRPLLEALWQAVQLAPAGEAFVEEKPYMPPTLAPERSEEEKFVYAQGGVEEDWEEAGEFETTNHEPPTTNHQPPTAKREPRTTKRESNFVNAAGEVVKPRTAPTRKKERMKRTILPPVTKNKGRTTAKERKKKHEVRVKKRSGTPEPAPAPAPAEIDTDLAAEIAAMKADDLRKGKYYTRSKKDLS